MTKLFWNIRVFPVGSIVSIDSTFNPLNGCVGIVSCVNEIAYGKETDVQILDSDTANVKTITITASHLVDGDPSHPDVRIIKDWLDEQESARATEEAIVKAEQEMLGVATAESLVVQKVASERQEAVNLESPTPVETTEGISDESYLTEQEEQECLAIIDSIIFHNQSIDEYLWKLKYQIFADGAKKSQTFTSFDEVCRYLNKEHKLPSPSTCHEKAWAYEEKRILIEELKIDITSVKLSVHTLLELRKEPDLEKKQELFETALNDVGAKGAITARDIQDAKILINNDDDEELPPKGSRKSTLRQEVETVTLKKDELQQMIQDAIASAMESKEQEFKESMIAYQIEVRESALAQAQEEMEVREKRAEERGKQEILPQYQLALRELEILRQKLAIASNMDSNFTHSFSPAGVNSY